MKLSEKHESRSIAILGRSASLVKGTILSNRHLETRRLWSCGMSTLLSYAFLSLNISFSCTTSISRSSSRPHTSIHARIHESLHASTHAHKKHARTHVRHTSRTIIILLNMQSCFTHNIAQAMAQRRMVHGWLVICVLLASSCAHAAWVGFTEGAGCVSSIIVNPAPYSVITLSPTFVVQFNLLVDLDLYVAKSGGSGRREDEDESRQERDERNSLFAGHFRIIRVHSQRASFQNFLFPQAMILALQYVFLLSLLLPLSAFLPLLLSDVYYVVYGKFRRQ